jgi:hypothetical protein
LTFCKEEYRKLLKELEVMEDKAREEEKGRRQAE